MPMTFTDDVVDSRLEMANLDQSGNSETKRIRLAVYSETEHGDFVEGWEIRTGRRWDDMSSDEAEKLIDQHPNLKGNPGVLSRLDPEALRRVRGELNRRILERN